MKWFWCFGLLIEFYFDLKRTLYGRTENSTMSTENQGEENLRLLALACSTQYSGGQWDNCLKSLAELGSPNDSRVKHNEFVVKYFKAGCTPAASELLLSSLSKLLNNTADSDTQSLTCARSVHFLTAPTLGFDHRGYL